MLSTAVTSRTTDGDGCSEAMTITCTATTVDNLFATPTITWLLSDGEPVPASGNPMMNSDTGQLIFSDITNENSGVYTCRASVTITEAGIEDHQNETTITVSTDSKIVRVR